MMSDAGLVDGSWELNITVTDLQVEKTLRVKGDVHIGGVMLKLVEALGMCQTILNLKGINLSKLLKFQNNARQLSKMIYDLKADCHLVYAEREW